ncbi:hypothetical protein AB5N19_08729 [Seiridium cardinale]
MALPAATPCQYCPPIATTSYHGASSAIFCKQLIQKSAISIEPKHQSSTPRSDFRSRPQGNIPRHAYKFHTSASQTKFASGWALDGRKAEGKGEGNGLDWEDTGKFGGNGYWSPVDTDTTLY